MIRLTFLMVIFLSFGMIAQQNFILNDIYSTEKNFFDIQREANAYFKEHGTGRGSGIKQYKRWEYITYPKVFPSGDLSLVNGPQAKITYRNYLNKKASQRSSFGTTPFEEFGKRSWYRSNSWNPGLGRLNHVTAQPDNPNILYVCAASGGLWKSEDHGDSWNCMTDDLDIDATSIIEFDLDNPEKIYLASGDRHGQDGASNGIFISTDGGETWEETSVDSEVTGGLVYDIYHHPTNSNHVYAGMQSGLYETKDGGETWTRLQSGVVTDIEFKPGSSTTMYYLASNQFYRSMNAGVTSTRITDGVPNMGRALIAVTEDNPNVVYYCYAESNIYGGLIRSINSGISFTTMSTRASVGNLFGYATDGSDDRGQAWYDMALAVDPQNFNNVIVGGIMNFRSENGGRSWTNAAQWRFPLTKDGEYNHADIHYLGYEHGKLYSGTDGGIFVSEDNGATWEDLSEGLGITQFYKFDVADHPSLRVVGGAQDNGTSVYKDGVWHEWLGADGMDGAINYNNLDIIHGSVQFGTFYKTDDGGRNDLGNHQKLLGPWVTPFTLDPNNPDVCYAGTSKLYISRDGMESIADSVEFSSSADIREIEVAKSNSNVIYVAQGVALQKSTDGGETWENVLSSFLGLISDISVDPLNENHVFVTISGFSEGRKVFESFDGGGNFENISEGLPNLSAASLIYFNNGTPRIYLGMDRGVYVYDFENKIWEDYSDGIPYCMVTELKVHPPSQMLYVATYGRGIWRRPLIPSEESRTNLAITLDHREGQFNCQEFFTPHIEIMNTSSKTVETFEISYEVEGKTISTKWNGNLRSGESTRLNLSETRISEGVQEVIYSITSVNGEQDDFEGDNIYRSSIHQTQLNDRFIEVRLTPDDYVEELSFEVLDVDGQLVGSSAQGVGMGKNGSTEIYSQRFEVSSNCFQVQLNDAFGDGFCCEKGQGKLAVLNNCGDTLAFYEGTFTSTYTIDACQTDLVAEEMDVELDWYPNPVSDGLFLTSNFEVDLVELYDNVGRKVMEYRFGNRLASYRLNTDGLTNGLYTMIVTSEGVNIQERVVIQQ